MSGRVVRSWQRKFMQIIKLIMYLNQIIELL